jgi:hypothetical protein
MPDIWASKSLVPNLDPSIIRQKQSFVTSFYDFLSLKNYVNIRKVGIKQRKLRK